MAVLDIIYFMYRNIDGCHSEVSHTTKAPHNTSNNVCEYCHLINDEEF